MALRLGFSTPLSLALWLAIGLFPDLVSAAPLVQFDTPAVVAVRDVTTHEFATLNPGEKVVEVVWRLSVLVTRGTEAEVDEVVVAMNSPERRARVLDYFPKTELSHDLVGPIQTSSNAQQHAAMKVNINTGWLNVAGPVQGQFDANRSQQQTTIEEYQRLPPRTAVLASGTTTHGHGVFFKLRRWSQAALEGAHEFRVWLAVPQSWRGDWMQVAALAKASDKNLFSASPMTVGERQFAVGLHIEADREARQIVEKLVSLRPASQELSTNSPLPKIAELFSNKSSAQAVRLEQERQVTAALQAVRKLSGHSNLR